MTFCEFSIFCIIGLAGGFCPGGALRIYKLLEMVKHGRVDTTKLISHHYEGFETIPDAFLLNESETGGFN